MFQKINSKLAKDIHVADGGKFEFGQTELEFSKPIYHGPSGSKLGFVLMLAVRTPNCCFLHAPDVQGPMYAEPLKWILNQKPEMLVMGGPPTYLGGFKVEGSELETAQRNLVELAKRIPQLIVDHHLLRSLEYLDYLSPALVSAKKAGHQVFAASEFIHQEPELLEARRKELHQREPMGREWYERLERGEFKGGFSEPTFSVKC